VEKFLSTADPRRAGIFGRAAYSRVMLGFMLPVQYCMGYGECLVVGGRTSKVCANRTGYNARAANLFRPARVAI
jgi:hypothetical protein